MKLLLSILLSFFMLVSCQKEDPTENVFVVQGFLRTNSVVQRITVTEINNDGFSNSPVSNALVTISNASSSIQLIESTPGVYEYIGNEFEVQPGDIYNLQVLHYNSEGEEKILSSQTRVPPTPEILNQDANSFGVDLNTDGNIVYGVSWDYEGDFSQVVDLVNIEANPSTIPFLNDVEPFEDLYNLPIPTKSLILKDLNFEFYGQHVLSINIISPEYEFLFFNDLENGQSDPPEGIDNIDGGEGYFTAVSREVILLELIE